MVIPSLFVCLFVDDGILADIVANGDAIGSALLVQTGRGQHQPLATLVPLEMEMVMAIVMP